MAMSMKQGDGGACCCTIEGEMTIYTALELKEQLMAALTQCSALELSMAGVDEIDSAGLQLLMLTKTEAKAQDKTLSLSDHSAAVLDILALCNLESFFGDPVLIRSRG